MPADDAMLSPPPEHHSPAARPTCPPEESRLHTPDSANRDPLLEPLGDGDGAFMPPAQQPTPPPADQERLAHRTPSAESQSKSTGADTDAPPRDTPTPMSASEDTTEDQRSARASPALSPAPSLPSRKTHSVYKSPFPSQRFLPNSSSSFLQPGSCFKGSQTSDRQQYEVEVEIKHVDMKDSFLCGYLRIKGLTEDHPSLTTYFEGEIIGSKHNFVTDHPEWGSNEKVDRQHWARFPAYKPLSKNPTRAESTTTDWMQKEHLFMRWKEYFLVPDHRVRTISGASFEGFYYICFHQVTGEIEGIYFHAKSEKFQKLNLKHVEDHGCHGAIEFC